MEKAKVMDLLPGDRFLTPGGNILTVEKVIPAVRMDHEYLSVVTQEIYAPGDIFTAHRDRLVEIVE